ARWARAASKFGNQADVEDAQQSGALAVYELLLELRGPEAINSSPGGYVRAVFIRGARASAVRAGGAPALTRKVLRLRRAHAELMAAEGRAITPAELLAHVEAQIVAASSRPREVALAKAGYTLADARLALGSDAA